MMCGVVNGTVANPGNNSAEALYLNVSQVFSKGEGQTAGQRG